METVVISLLAPVTPSSMERWVEAQVDELRAQGRASGVRLGRLARSTPAQGGDWLIEVDREGRAGPLQGDLALASILTDMAALGLRPQLFVVSGERRGGRSRDAHRPGADGRRQPARHSRPGCRRAA